MFPDIFQLITRHTRFTAKCTKIHFIEISGAEIQNPSLLIIQLICLIISFYTLIRTFKPLPTAGYFFGSLFYLLMILSSIPLHTMTTDYKQILQILDIVFTGSSALSFWYTRLMVPKRAYLFTFLILLGYNLKHNYLKPIPFMNELTYILPCFVAIVANLRKLNLLGTSLNCKFLASIGLLVVSIGLVFDDELCLLTSGHLASTHCVFFGSAISMLGLVELRLSNKDMKPKVD